MAATDDYEKRKAFIASFIGVYNFEHPGGKFEVHLRSDERFFAPLYQTKSTWCFDAAEAMVLALALARAVVVGFLAVAGSDGA